MTALITRPVIVRGSAQADDAMWLSRSGLPG
jgi:hypothetical protein